MATTFISFEMDSIDNNGIAQLPPAYVVRRESTVFTGICLFSPGRYPISIPIILPLVPCPFWGCPVTGPRPLLGCSMARSGGTPARSRWGGYPSQVGMGVGTPARYPSWGWGTPTQEWGAPARYGVSPVQRWGTPLARDGVPPHPQMGYPLLGEDSRWTT